MDTTNSDGWPYLQHLGGLAGFLRVLGPHQLGFADFKGNRQMLTTGNLDGNARVALFLIELVSFDWNCPQYITPCFTEAQVEAHMAPLKARIAELESQLAGR